MEARVPIAVLRVIIVRQYIAGRALQ